MGRTAGHLNDPVLTHVRRDPPILRQDASVGEALDAIRRQGLGEHIIYFYVTDEDGRLAGVVPTRRMLTAALSRRLSEIMVTRVIAIPDTATMLDACEYFVLHRLLAFPVVDRDRRIVGLVDAHQFTEEVIDLTDREQAQSVFETFGFRIAEIRKASPARAFLVRFPWTIATMAGGLACAAVTWGFEATLAENLVLAFFLALMLGFGESVSMQSEALAVQALYAIRPGWKWYLRALRREAATAALLGGACGLSLAAVVGLWQGMNATALVMAIAVLGSLLWACIIGLTVPTILHALRLDLRISAGPVTLAMADVGTIVIYLVTGYLLLARP